LSRFDTKSYKNSQAQQAAGKLWGRGIFLHKELFPKIEVLGKPHLNGDGMPVSIMTQPLSRCTSRAKIVIKRIMSLSQNPAGSGKGFEKSGKSPLFLLNPRLLF
jgi:hypothetical protein